MNDNKVKKYPLRHLSIRVPWHDRGWDGTVCKSPEKNSACLKLTRISKNKDEEAEVKIAGKSIKELDQNLWPCCIPERSAFMSSFYFIRDVEHPYHKSSPTTHGHIQRTPVRHPAYSAATVPFRWMFKESFKEFSLEYGLNLDTAREPDLKFKTPWVQDHQNQRELLNCFFNHIKPESSLCFFYAKQVPFVEDSRRVLIGVGRVLHIGDISEYSYSKESEFRSVIWERMIQHSIRPEFNDGFLLPYHKAIKHAQDNPDFDPSIIAAFAPQDHWLEFSYAAEHVSHDGAISSLLSCAASLNNAKKYLPGQWDKCLRWINDRLGEIWKMRGPCPGLGSALCAFGIEQGTFIAREIEAKLEENVDPWPVIDQILTETTDILSMETSKTIGTTIRKTWAKLPQERKSLLKLISRFELSPAQARLLYVQEEREKAQIQHTDSQILENPYLIYELTRLTTDPISIWTVDRGVFPEKIVREKHPLPSPSELDTGLDVRRVRALVVDVLERSADNGNTLLSRKDIILIIRNLELQPSCDVTGDIMEVAEEIFPGVVERILFNDGNPAYQLLRLAQVGDVIRNAVLKRKDGKRHIVNENWEQFLNSKLDPTEPGDMKQEKRARIEKAAALKELSESRISVLIGPAGTGKTTLLSILCSQKDIAEGEVLLLAPTGKARVRMQEETNRRGLDIKGLTIAQFLGKSNRYDYKTGIYRLSDIKAEVGEDTVIIDEASMLTEEMLGALLQALRGVKRIIMVGDPRQLPPIGTGRPFVDVVSELSPENVQGIFPRISKGYAELTVRRRQEGKDREDIQLAEWFSGNPISPGDDDIFDKIIKDDSSDYVRFARWETPEEFQNIFLNTLVSELNLDGPEDVIGFEKMIGAKIKDGYGYFNVGAASNAENWQVLSPTRGNAHGVISINRRIHKKFRSKTIEFAQSNKYRKIPKPMGGEQIIYGDKVINITNHKRDNVFPQEGAARYIANGEIGIVVGQFKTPKMRSAPWLMKVEFSSQPGYQYDFRESDFDEESEPKLELSYALTIHKAQGSEFDIVILVIPNPCHLLSREMIYTALTRQRNRIIILHQGSIGELRKFASDAYSETAARQTNLFKAPEIVKIEGKLFENSLIHVTSKGEFVRSKSEVIIADRLSDLGVEYVYEKELTIDGVSKFPDFTIEDVETGRTFYWEHCGMMQVPEYRSRWEKKLEWYKEHGIIPHDKGERGTLIITTDTEEGGISSQEIERVIKTVILDE